MGRPQSAGHRLLLRCRCDALQAMLASMGKKKMTADAGAKPVTLKVLAAHLKLDPATVSVVLNDVPGRSIPEATLLISFVRAKLDAKGNISDPKLADDVRSVVFALAQRR